MCRWLTGVPFRIGTTSAGSFGSGSSVSVNSMVRPGPFLTRRACSPSSRLEHGGHALSLDLHPEGPGVGHVPRALHPVHALANRIPLVGEGWAIPTRRGEGEDRHRAVGYGSKSVVFWSQSELCADGQ